MRDREPVLFHVLDMLGPEIDEGHVLAGLDHMRAGIATDRARAHHRNLLARRHKSSSNRSGPRAAIRRRICKVDPSTGEPARGRMAGGRMAGEGWPGAISGAAVLPAARPPPP